MPPSILRDLKSFIRSFSRSRLFLLTTVLPLAFAIGASTVIFSVVDAVLLRPLPFENPAQLFLLRATNKGRDAGAVSAPDFLDWKAGADSFESLSSLRTAS